MAKITKISYRKKLEINPDIVITDRDPENDLDIFCYRYCDDNSSNETQECRGIVFKGGLIILRSFPYTINYSTSETSEIERIPLASRFFTSYEGTLIRVFWYNNKWYVSTHRKLFANKAKWSSQKTFGDMFYEGLYNEFKNNPKFLPNIDREVNIDVVKEKFFDGLDKNQAHMFLIRSMGTNRIVCNEPKQTTVYFIASFLKKELKWDNPLNFTVPQEQYFKTHEDLINTVENMDPLEMQGIIAFCPGNKQIKVMHSIYFRKYRLRDNQPSINFRYLQIRHDKDKVKEFKEMYPENAEIFDIYEKFLDISVKRIFYTYKKRYINGEYAILPQSEYKVMQLYVNCNKTQDHDPKETIKSILNCQNPEVLNQIINGSIKKNIKGIIGNVADLLAEKWFSNNNKTQIEKKCMDMIFDRNPNKNFTRNDIAFYATKLPKTMLLELAEEIYHNEY